MYRAGTVERMASAGLFLRRRVYNALEIARLAQGAAARECGVGRGTRTKNGKNAGAAQSWAQAEGRRKSFVYLVNCHRNSVIVIPHVLPTPNPEKICPSSCVTFRPLALDKSY